jgi:uncharacterized protein (TIGR03083 family)
VTTGTKDQFVVLTRDELGDLRALLHELTDAQWDRDSLCAGWKVRHVVGHLCLGSQISPWQLPAKTARFRFNVAKASSMLSFEYGEHHRRDELLDTFDWLAAHPGKPGLAKIVPVGEYFTDKLIHHQDIRRPLGLPREIPAERLVAALDALPKIGGFLKSRRTTRGLRLVATDLDHRVGEGPEVRGPAEALILAGSGRPVGLAELSGPGLPLLADRIT